MTHKIYIRLFRNSPIARVSLIVFLFFWLRLFLACVPPVPEDFFYNKITLDGYNNSGVAQGFAYSDTLYNEAVAFELTLSDSAYYNDNFYAGVFRDLGFQQVLAFETLSEYNPLNKIDRIRIYTINPINTYFGADSEITDSILYDPHNGFSVYSLLDDAANYMNKTQSAPYTTVRLIVKPAVLNATAKFRISVLFENGTILTDTTKNFTIIHPE